MVVSRNKENKKLKQDFENWKKEEARIRAEVLKKRPSIRPVTEEAK